MGATLVGGCRAEQAKEMKDYVGSEGTTYMNLGKGTTAAAE